MSQKIIHLVVSNVLLRTQCFHCGTCTDGLNLRCIFQVKFQKGFESEFQFMDYPIRRSQTVEFIEKILHSEVCLECELCGCYDGFGVVGCFFSSKIWDKILKEYYSLCSIDFNIRRKNRKKQLFKKKQELFKLE